MTVPNNKLILMIDDDATLAGFLGRYLAKYNYAFRHAANAKDGLKELERAKPDAILLDINLPGASGLDVCREIRSRSIVPVVMISSLGETADRVVGLQAGADSYLPKPFEPRELVAHLDSLFRRAELIGSQKKLDKVSMGGLEVDLSRRECLLDGKPLAISSAEFDLLSVFIAEPGHVFSRDELLNRLRGVDWEAYDRSVDIIVSRLRKKLGDTPKNCRFLKTVWGAGYVFMPQEKGRKAG